MGRQQGLEWRHRLNVPPWIIIVEVEQKIHVGECSEGTVPHLCPSKYTGASLLFPQYSASSNALTLPLPHAGTLLYKL